MKSEKVEYIRFDDLQTGILMGNKPYILARGDLSSLQEVRMPFDQIELLEALGDRLRYDSSSKDNPNASPDDARDDKWDAIHKCSDQIRSMCLDLDTLPDDVSHLELYLNPSELSLIPFELLLDKKGSPRFVGNNGKMLVLTRNFRRTAVPYVEIPKKPRVLFVHTKPDHKNYLGLPFPDVPFKNHAQSLRYALRHGNLEKQLTVLADPTFEAFKNTVRQAEGEKNAFTHIHILAHGSLLFDHKRPSNFEYGIAFHSDAPPKSLYKATTAQEMRTFFESLRDLPYLVNYMICDGANFTNGTKADRNPVQATFKAGVPIIIGSQFPLSMEGSKLITKELYKRLFRGGDIRKILGDIRTKLYAMEPADQHDWISLVSYVDLPDDYEFRLLMLKMEFQLDILNSIRDQSARAENGTLPTKDDFIRARVQVEESIADLSSQVAEIEHEKSKEAAFLENSGLLGSAYKRLAEIEFQESVVIDTATKEKQKKHLRQAKTWYKKAADRNLSHHWSLTQYISLCCILDGGLKKGASDYWNTARLGALTEIAWNDSQNEKSIWSYGTLLELYLLTPDGNREASKNRVQDYAENLMENCKESGNKEAISATKHQLLRYRNWWNSSDYQIPEGMLALDKGFLETIIKRLEA